MRLAVVDLGSNTVRMSVYDQTEDGWRLILSEKEVIGLIGYTTGGVLSEDGIIRLVETIRGFCETGRAIDTGRFCCFATAGLRAVRNADEVVKRIAGETGLQAEIISGEEEARCDFLGAFRPAGLERGLVVDMGGGSTEFVRFEQAHMENSISLPFGSLLLYRRFVGSILPRKSEADKIRRFVKKQLGCVEWLPDCAGHACLIGGTARAAARLHREIYAREHEAIQGYTFDALDFRDMLGQIGSMGRAGGKLLARSVPERVHTIVPGLIELSQIVKIAGCRTVSISRSGVREGYLCARTEMR